MEDCAKFSKSRWKSTDTETAPLLTNLPSASSRPHHLEKYDSRPRAPTRLRFPYAWKSESRGNAEPIRPKGGRGAQNQHRSGHKKPAPSTESCYAEKSVADSILWLVSSPSIQFE